MTRTRSIRPDDKLVLDDFDNIIGIEDSNGSRRSVFPRSITEPLTGEIAGFSTPTGKSVQVIFRNAGYQGAIIGDSIGANCSNKSPLTNLFSSIKSWVHWGLAFHGGDIAVEPANNFAVGGSSSADALVQVDSAIAAGVHVCFIQTGINDPTFGFTLTQSLTNIKKIVSKLKGSGIIPVIRLNSPNGAAGWTTAMRRQSMQFNEEVKSYWGNAGSGVGVHDPYPLYLDTSLTTSNPRAALVNADLLHPEGVGAAQEGPSLANVLTQLGFPPRRVTNWGAADAFDKAGNPLGNLLNNDAGLSYGALTGTTGTCNGIAPAGIYAGSVVATGWDITEITGTTALVASIEDTPILVNGLASGATYKRQVITFTPVAGDTVRFRSLFGSITNAGRFLAVGDSVFCEIECEVIAANANGGLANIHLLGTTGGNFQAMNGLFDQAGASGLLPISNQGKFVIRTSLGTLVSGFTGYIFDAQFKVATGSTGAVTVKFGMPRLVKQSALALAAL